RLYTEPYLDERAPRSLYAEIQLTGWLYDGGILMWIFYGGAIISSLVFAYKSANRHPDPEVRYLAGLVFALNLIVCLAAWDAPVFNTQTGIQFWTLTGALAGVCLNNEEAELSTEQSVHESWSGLHSPLEAS